MQPQGVKANPNTLGGVQTTNIKSHWLSKWQGSERTFLQTQHVNDQ